MCACININHVAAQGAIHVVRCIYSLMTLYYVILINHAYTDSSLGHVRYLPVSLN